MLTDKNYELKNRIKGSLSTLLDEITTFNEHEKKWVCPFCDSGAGPKRTSAFSVDGELWHCHKCGAGGDALTLIAKRYGWDTQDDFPKVLEKGAEMLGLGLGDLIPVKQRKERGLDCRTSTQTRKQNNMDHTKEINDARASIEDSAAEAYLSKRGISMDTAKRHGLGFNPSWSTGAGTPSPCLILPTSQGGYTARAINSDSKRKQGSGKGFFNPSALGGSEPVFVVEGEFDALSLLECGFQAIALCSTVNVDAFLDELEIKDVKHPVIIAMDNDEPGRKATEKFSEGMKKLSVPYVVADSESLFCGKKDANEAWVKHKDLFIDEVKKVSERAKRECAKWRPEEEVFLADELAFLSEALERADVVTRTGFAPVDSLLPNSGFAPAGLYLLGGGAGSGKSALCLQLADSLADQGKKVLYLSFEMDKAELFRRSIFRQCREQKMDPNEAFLQMKQDPAGFVETFPSVRNLKIEDFDEFPSITAVARKVKSFIERHGSENCFVFVDYLQLIQLEPNDRRNSNNVDRLQEVAFQLRSLSKKCPFFVISSLNRESQKGAKSGDEYDLTSFMGSGALEYSANWAAVLFEPKSSATEQEKSISPSQERKLKCVKSRNGKTGESNLQFVGENFRFMQDEGVLPNFRHTHSLPSMVDIGKKKKVHSSTR